MGCTASVKSKSNSDNGSTFRPIPDRFKTIQQVQKAVREAGLESSNLILGIDFTKSNTWTGAETFSGRCLHDTKCGVPNPYHRVIDVIGRTLEEFDDDRLIPAFGFGDASTGDVACFPFASGGPIHTVNSVLKRYTEIANEVQLAGPTCFAPCIRQAIDIVREERSYHILVIIADGQVTDASPTGPTARAIIEASQYPLSIVVVGVGDGPWHAMEHYDDELPQRRFDNFQFVDFNRIARLDSRVADAQFALHALMEVPDQYKFIKENGLLSSPAFDHPAQSPAAKLVLSRTLHVETQQRQQLLPRLPGPESPAPCESPATAPVAHVAVVPFAAAISSTSQTAKHNMLAPPDYSVRDMQATVHSHLQAAAPPAAEWY